MPLLSLSARSLPEKLNARILNVIVFFGEDDAQTVGHNHLSFHIDHLRDVRLTERTERRRFRRSLDDFRVVELYNTRL